MLQTPLFFCKVGKHRATVVNLDESFANCGKEFQWARAEHPKTNSISNNSRESLQYVIIKIALENFKHDNAARKVASFI